MYTKIIKPTMKEIKEKTESSKIIGSKKICRFCNTEFSYGSKSRTSCGLCKINYFCKYCNKEITSKISLMSGRTQLSIYKLVLENNIKSYSACCSTSHSRMLYNKEQVKPGVCRSCKIFSKIRNSYGLCPNCTDKSKGAVCIKCKESSDRLDTTGRCPKCASKAGIGICFKCKKDKNNLNAFGICVDCMSGPGNCTTCGNLSNTRNATGQCKECISINFKPLFQENNYCSMHKNQKLSYKEECWDCYKEKFNKNNKIPKNFSKYNPVWQNTYRTNRNNRSGQLAMEKELVEKNIAWFVYIKFYEVNNSIKPLQVCKSGSKLVNLTGSDVGFSTKVEHGAARRFLKESNLKWHIEKILIFPCETEKKAYQLEEELALEFCLFTS